MTTGLWGWVEAASRDCAPDRSNRIQGAVLGRLKGFTPEAPDVGRFDDIDGTCEGEEELSDVGGDDTCGAALA